MNAHGSVLWPLRHAPQHRHQISEEMHCTCWSGVKKPASAHFSISFEENSPWIAPLGSTYSHSVGLLNLGVPALTKARLHPLKKRRQESLCALCNSVDQLRLYKHTLAVLQGPYLRLAALWVHACCPCIIDMGQRCYLPAHLFKQSGHERLPIDMLMEMTGKQLHGRGDWLKREGHLRFRPWSPCMQSQRSQNMLCNRKCIITKATILRMHCCQGRPWTGIRGEHTIL